VIKKDLQSKEFNPRFQRNAFGGFSSSHAMQFFDEERTAQREEFLKREQANRKSSSQKFSPKKAVKSAKPKAMTVDQKLELTNQWLEETFPHLFAADDFIPLDHQLLRDLKADYKNNALKKGYPQDLVIKGAFYRYVESYGYLGCIKEGSPRYNLKGEVCGTVTKQEEESAQKILATL